MARLSQRPSVSGRRATGRAGDSDPTGARRSPHTPVPQPHQAERRKLHKTLGSGQDKIDRLLDAYTYGALDLAGYKKRPHVIPQDLEQAQRRLDELDQAPVQAPTAPAVHNLAKFWPTLSVDARRDVAAALLFKVQVNQDKTVELHPRWGQPLRLTFRKHGTIPVLPAQ